MNNSLLDFDIEYDILDSFDTEKLYEYNFIPLYKEQLFVIVATSNEDNDIDKLVDLFQGRSRQAGWCSARGCWGSLC